MIARLFVALSLIPLLVRALLGCDREQMRMRIMGLVDCSRLPAAKYVEHEDEMILVQDEAALAETKESEYKRLVKAAENARAVGKYRSPTLVKGSQEKPLGQCRLCYAKCADDARICAECDASTRTQRYRPKGVA